MDSLILCAFVRKQKNQPIFGLVTFFGRFEEFREAGSLRDRRESYLEALFLASMGILSVILG